MAKKIFIVLIAAIVLIPLGMWTTWLFTPKQKLVVAIIDKSVMTQNREKHLSVNWVLNNEQLTKTSQKSYDAKHDYFGFFPLEDEKYKVKGLERYSSHQLKQLSTDTDVVYFTDTYGVYNSDWYKEESGAGKPGMLYGGLSQNDIEYLKLMKQEKKLILAEFNTIGSPTFTENRHEFEKLFSLKWTGWTGRYFNNLDIEKNSDIPQWMIDGYTKTSGTSWNFKNAGIIFIGRDKQIVVLEEGSALNRAMPFIKSTPQAQKELSLPESVKYPFWFDVMQPDLSVNSVEASFDIAVNEKGKALLAQYNIPFTFPAITSHTGTDYDFYYFSGDFSDNPVNFKSSYFKGISAFKSFFYDDRQPLERGSFFWKFYKPLLSTILENYAAKK
ncbi:MAG: hypothetical protein V7767_00500 [Leeuwenhoekiella sp.]